jgi:sugar lactone lactonase YvrE
MKFRLLITGLMLSVLTHAQSKPQLIQAFKSDVVWNGVTVSDEGRVFVCFPRLEGDSGMRIGEIKPDGKIVPYPDQSWNNWKTGDQVKTKIIRANSLRIGPDGKLWIVDTGAPKLGEKALPGGCKLIEIDLTNNKVIRTILLNGVMKPNSFIDDLRLYGSTIYLTDAGEPALIVMNKETGKGRRVLENQPSVTDTIPMFAEGKVMRTNDGKDLHINADQLEVSPDGKYLYFQPASGSSLSRIETKYLNNPELSATQLSVHVVKWVQTPTTGGTAIDLEGNIYASDVNHLRIIKITPAGRTSVIIKDNRLIWCDALWIDKKGYLWMPCGQINRLAAFQNGVSQVKYPVHIYKMQIHAKPFRS